MGEEYIFPLVRKEKNYKMHDFKYEIDKIVYQNDVKKNDCQVRNHFIVIFDSSSVFTL